jgi:hypothetical protein
MLLTVDPTLTGVGGFSSNHNKTNVKGIRVIKNSNSSKVVN